MSVPVEEKPTSRLAQVLVVEGQALTLKEMNEAFKKQGLWDWVTQVCIDTVRF